MPGIPTRPSPSPVLTRESASRRAWHPSHRATGEVLPQDDVAGRTLGDPADDGRAGQAADDGLGGLGSDRGEQAARGLGVEGEVDPELVNAVGDLEQQMKNAYADLEAVLQHYGCTFDDVVVENVFTTDMATFLEIAGYRNSIYTNNFPTGTWLEVKGLALPEFMIEIELEAHCPK